MAKASNIVIPEQPKPEPPSSMDDLLAQAHNDWKFKRKDDCIMKLLSALAIMSTGVAGAMKTANQALQLAVEAHDKASKDDCISNNEVEEDTK